MFYPQHGVTPICSQLYYYIDTPEQYWNLKGTNSASLLEETNELLSMLEQKLVPIPELVLGKKLFRLLLHAPFPTQGFEIILENYKAQLSPYPEDLIEQAYNHLLKNFHFKDFPKIKEFIDIMSPEMEKRVRTKCKLSALKKKLLSMV